MYIYIYIYIYIYTTYTYTLTHHMFHPTWMISKLIFMDETRLNHYQLWSLPRLSEPEEERLQWEHPLPWMFDLRVSPNNEVVEAPFGFMVVIWSEWPPMRPGLASTLLREQSGVLLLWTTCLALLAIVWWGLGWWMGCSFFWSGSLLKAYRLISRHYPATATASMPDWFESLNSSVDSRHRAHEKNTKANESEPPMNWEKPRNLLNGSPTCRAIPVLTMKLNIVPSMTRILIDRIDSLWTLRLSQQHRTYFDGESPDPQSNWTRGTSLQCQLLSSGVWGVQFHNLQRAKWWTWFHRALVRYISLQPVSISPLKSFVVDRSFAVWKVATSVYHCKSIRAGKTPAMGVSFSWGIPGSLASGRSSGTLHGDLSGHPAWHPAWRFPKSQSTPKSSKLWVIINGKTNGKIDGLGYTIF